MSEEKFSPERILDEFHEDQAIREYASRISKLEKRLANTEKDITEVSLGYSGLVASREFTFLERRYQDHINELMDLRTAVLLETLEPVDLESNSESQNSSFQQAAVAGEFDDCLDRLDRLAHRTNQRLTSRRTAANTRLALTISVIAVILSAISIIMM